MRTYKEILKDAEWCSEYVNNVTYILFDLKRNEEARLALGYDGPEFDPPATIFSKDKFVRAIAAEFEKIRNRAVSSIVEMLNTTENVRKFEEIEKELTQDALFSVVKIDRREENLDEEITQLKNRLHTFQQLKYENLLELEDFYVEYAQIKHLLRFETALVSFINNKDNLEQAKTDATEQMSKLPGKIVYEKGLKWAGDIVGKPKEIPYSCVQTTIFDL